jgi:hypothetical protein
MYIRVLLLALAFLFSGSGAHACDCSSLQLKPRDLAAFLTRAHDAVFEGEAVLVEPVGVRVPPGDGPSIPRLLTRFQFRVHRVHKGETAPFVWVESWEEDSRCPFRFQPGQHYLVFATRTPVGELKVHGCFRQGLLSEAGAALRYLRGEPPTEDDLVSPTERKRLADDSTLETTGGIFCGRLLRPDGEPARNAIVWVWSADAPLETQARPLDLQFVPPGEQFRIRFLPPGRYLLGARERMHDEDRWYLGFYPNASRPEDAAVLFPRAAPDQCDTDLVLPWIPVAQEVTVRVVTEDLQELPPGQLQVILRRNPHPSEANLPVVPQGAAPSPAERERILLEGVPYGEYTMLVTATGQQATRWQRAEVPVTIREPRMQLVVELKRRE